MDDNLTRERALKIFSILSRLYGPARPGLTYEKDYQLLVAVILSARATDKKVNQVTRKLFKRFADVFSLAEASPEEIIEIIREVGLFRTKAHYIISACHKLIDEFEGKVPNSFDELISLPGVGRKSANVLLANLFGEPTITVDTHVKRVTYRLGFTNSTDPKRIEYDLKKLWPREIWVDFCFGLISLGREICKSRVPICKKCELALLCPKHMI